MQELIELIEEFTHFMTYDCIITYGDNGYMLHEMSKQELYKYLYDIREKYFKIKL